MKHLLEVTYIFSLSPLSQKQIFMFCTSFVLRCKQMKKPNQFQLELIFGQCGSKHEDFLGRTYVSDKSYKITSYFSIILGSLWNTWWPMLHSKVETKTEARSTLVTTAQRIFQGIYYSIFHFPIVSPISILFITWKQPILNPKF